MGQCSSQEDEYVCIICNKSSLKKSLFICPICKTDLGHMDCVTFWIIKHKKCPCCDNTILI